MLYSSLHVREPLEFKDDPGGNSTGVSVQPLQELAVVGECGQDWSLVSLLIQTPRGDYFNTGYVANRMLMEEAPSCSVLAGQLREAPYRGSSSSQESGETLYVLASAVMVREGPESTAAVLQKLGYGVAVNALSRACGDWVLVASPFGRRRRWRCRRRLARPCVPRTVAGARASWGAVTCC